MTAVPRDDTTLLGPAGGRSARRRPDSGAGWLAVASSFLALGVAFGVAYNFGSLIRPMRESLHVGASQLGWIFSVSSFAFLALGASTGRLADRYGPRPLLASGALFIAAGLTLASTADGLAVAVVGYLGVGVGVSCVYVPAVANVGAWFVRYRVQAIGIAVTGIGVGTIVGPLVTAVLVDAVGWRRADVYLGLAAMLLLLACVPAMPTAPRARRAAGSWPWRRLAGDRIFRTLYFSGLAIGLCIYVPFVFLAPMAEHSGITPVRAAALVSVIGFASTAARVLFGLVAGRVGVAFAFKAATLTMWVGFLVWVPSRSYGALVAVALLFGAGYGGIIALTPALLAGYFGVDNLGSAAGALFTSASVGALFGAPLAGLLIGAGDRYRLTVVVVLAVASMGTVGQVLLPRTRPEAA